MEEKGYITVNVRTAGGVLPVGGALITVSIDGGGTVAVMLSDPSGTSDVIALDTPPRENSLSPENSGAVASFYTVETNKDGFYPVVNTGIPVYAGVTSIQSVILVPIATGNVPVPEEETRYDSGSLPNL